MPPPTIVDLVLFVVFVIVLVLPFKVRIVEQNLEAFLFLMGGLAVTVTNRWAFDLIRTAAVEPLAKGIVPAVLVAGLIFHYGRPALERSLNAIMRGVPIGVVIFAVTVLLGLLSSVITAIIAALLLVEVVNLMPLDRKAKIDFVIISCFAIGLGAVLTPLGEPLSTIAVVKLAGPPYHASFWYLFDQLGVLIVLGVLGCAVCALLRLRGRTAQWAEGLTEVADVSALREVFVRSAKVYAFVSALFLLGAGMEVIVDKYFTHLPATVLYWFNLTSAILDNATLTAAEIAPAMTQAQINAALMGLLISGGMLIPGNIPNIIAAGRLGITSREWARLGIPLGLALNIAYFVAIFYLGFSPKLGLL